MHRAAFDEGYRTHWIYHLDFLTLDVFEPAVGDRLFVLIIICDIQKEQ